MHTAGLPVAFAGARARAVGLSGSMGSARASQVFNTVKGSLASFIRSEWVRLEAARVERVLAMDRRELVVGVICLRWSFDLARMVGRRWFAGRCHDMLIRLQL